MNWTRKKGLTKNSRWIEEENKMNEAIAQPILNDIKIIILSLNISQKEKPPFKNGRTKVGNYISSSVKVSRTLTKY